MSSSDVKRRAVLGLLAGAPLLLGGCGFRSALTTRPGAGGTDSNLTLVEHVYVHHITYRDGSGSERTVHDLYNALVDRFGEPERPAFSLRSSYERRSWSSGVSMTDRSSRWTVQGTLAFSLFALNQEGQAPPRLLFQGQEVSWSSFDRMDSPFSDRIAEREMDRQIALRLADQVFNRVVAWIARANEGRG
ncbi:hypothetical protein IHV25_07910 [Phaeovibrio sulfidiphilus]|uniref:Lipoprotein n=1 Tax=Phaeovibrio sulfidiphilus TaxID=1220600 RepID=A0A8J6YQ05_9PROT|nr:hypothetical protein [Phaeovibrio sulfidiphilus]MBE1237571.1 hypothetical protein [Phaeovibrio sulfidiphilus]